MNSIPELRKDVAKTKVFAFDFETTSETGDAKGAKNPWTASPYLLSISTKNKSGCLHITEEVTAFFRELMYCDEYIGMAHNLPYDAVVAHRSKMIDFFNVKATLIDTLVLWWMVDENISHGLKDLSRTQLKSEMRSYDDVVNSENAQVIATLEYRLKLYEQTYEQWDSVNKKGKVPFPKLTSDPLSWTKIRRQLITENGINEPKSKAARQFLIQKRDELYAESRRELYGTKLAEFAPKARREIESRRLVIDKELKEYAMDDTKKLFPLARKARNILEAEGTLEWALKVEMPVRLECIRAELRGFTIDYAGLLEDREQIVPLIETFEKEIYTLAGRDDIDLNSSQQLSSVIFKELWCDPPPNSYHIYNNVRYAVPSLTSVGEQILRTLGLAVTVPIYNGRKTEERFLINWDNIPDELRNGGLAVDQNVIKSLAHPIGQALLNYRTAQKLYSTYIEGFLESMTPERPVIHGKFNSVGTETGRYASSGPNLQNIPSRSKGKEFDKRIASFGKHLRRRFIPPPPDELAPNGYAMIVADQSQIELRLAAHFTQDPGLIKAYTDSIVIDGTKYYTGDIHQQTAESLNIPRSPAKNVNFGFLYGMGANKYARMNRVFLPGTFIHDINTAAKWKEGYLQTYSNIRRAHRELKNMWDQGIKSFQTLCGRSRHFTYVVDSDDEPSAGTILNSIIQGSGADMIKMSKRLIEKHLYPLYPGLRFYFTVHDELGYVCPVEQAEEIAVLIKYIMEYPMFDMEIPVLVGCKVCTSWADKDNDDVPEIGSKFVQYEDGELMIVTRDNWEEYLAKKDKKVSSESSVAVLTPQQIAFCKSRVKLPVKQSNVVTVSRDELLANRT